MDTYTEEEIVEALRQEFLRLPRYSFHIGRHGGVVRVNDRSGNWVDWTSVHQVLDSSVSVDWVVAKLRAARALKAAAKPSAS